MKQAAFLAEMDASAMLGDLLHGKECDLWVTKHSRARSSKRGAAFESRPCASPRGWLDYGIFAPVRVRCFWLLMR